MIREKLMIETVIAKFTLFLQPYVKADLISKVVIPFFAIVFSSVFFKLQTNEITTLANSSLASWKFYGNQLLFTALEIGIIYLFKIKSLRSDQPKEQCFIWWTIGFIAIPIIILTVIQQFDFYQETSGDSYGQFVILWLVEAVMLCSRLAFKKNISAFSLKLNLDGAFLILIVFASAFWAFVFNSYDDPLSNLPIHILFDLQRNLEHVSSYFLYFIQFAVIYSSVYFIYWVNHYVLINKVLTLYGVGVYVFSAIFFLLFGTPIICQLLLWLPINDGSFALMPTESFNPFAFGNYTFSFLAFFVSSPIILAFNWQKKNKQIIELENKSIQNELLWLQQQINPHFLFNTLNNIYSLALINSEKTAETILKLAGILRFVVYQGHKKKVSLKDELSYLQGYLAIQQLRVNHKCDFTINFPENTLGLSITPLLLINFVENAFKHGVEATDKRSSLEISIEIKEHNLLFKCINSLPSASLVDKGGVGLPNVIRRLELLYPNKFNLNTNHKKETYEVSLSLTLD